MSVHPVPPAGQLTDRLVGASPAIAVLRAQIQQLVRFDTLGNPAVPTLLLQGETGTGKSLVARVVHDSGPRATGPWLELNCATLPETMLEAELFGFEVGAFTDAKRAKPGLFEAASGGTLFLDEIDAVPLALQGKLLTALESKRVRRLGAVSERVVDVKIIAATNADLHACVSTGRLRADLYHRLAVVILTLPPVRVRGEDVVLLAQTFLQQLGAAHGVPPKRLEPEAEAWLQQYAWPGNVRELQHVLERVTLLHAGDSVTAASLAQWCQPLQAAPSPSTAVLPEPEPPTQQQPLEPSLSAEALQIQQALVRAAGNVVQAARELGLSRDQLRTRMRRYGLTRQQLFTLPAAGGPPLAHTLLPEAARPAAQDTRPLASPTQAEAIAPPVPASPVPPAMTSSEDHPAPGGARTALGERRQLTVMFCDLADATVLASQCDPEDWQAVLQAYYAQCAEVTVRYGGSLAQSLDAGLLLYFGYPQAHEDAALRAVRAGLALVEALEQLHPPGGLAPLRVRIGVHTGPVVISPVAVGARQDALALGETPHLATRLPRVAPPGTVVCSATTARLVTGYVTLDALDTDILPNVPTALPVYRVVGETGVYSRLEIPSVRGLTPFVGRETELALLRERWAQVQDGQGQVVVVRGEAGIGKSRLVRLVQDEVVGSAALQIVYQGVAMQQHSPFAPVIAHLHRVCGWRADDLPEARLHQLEQALAAVALPLPEAVPLLAALVSLPLPPRYPPLALAPQQQKQRTIEILIRWLLHETARHPVLLVVEDLHWIDPSTLEWLTALIDQVPMAALYVLGTCRPEFIDPWLSRTYCTQLTLTRLAPSHVAAMVTGVAGGKHLPPAVVQQVEHQTDGVPLFVEELTKTMLESGWLQACEDHYELTGPLPPVAIPATLHDALTARLDRLATVKAVAQLGATIGRHFGYTLLHSVALLDEAALQQSLLQLVAAEILYQRGMPPQATYTFKQALIQDVAYQSLLKSTRQQYHQRIAQTLEAQFPEIVETQPELLAHHYTEAGLHTDAVRYWQQAGAHALARLAHAEAVVHLRKGLELLTLLPDTPTRSHQELDLLARLGPAMMAIKGFAAPEVEHIYARAHELCGQVGDTPQLFPVLWGVWTFYAVHAELRTAQSLAARLLTLAQSLQGPGRLMQAHRALGQTLYWLGELPLARAHLEHAITLYDLPQHRSHAFLYGQDSGAYSLSLSASVLGLLGFPDQALKRMDEALTLARELAYPLSLAIALSVAFRFHQLRRERQAVDELAETLTTLATEHGFAQFAALATIMGGWVLTGQGQTVEGIGQMRRGIAAYKVTGAQSSLPFNLTLLAEACGKGGQPEEGLTAVAEALVLVQKHDNRLYEAELYRLQGVLLALTAAQHTAIEACFQQALTIARRQQAKSLELRAAMSLARLWQQQGKRAEARQLLGEIYGWFTEGFDTADLCEARALLDELG